MKSTLRAGALIVLAPLLLAALAACAPTVALEPAADATNPGCAEIIVRLPDSVGGQQIRETNAQATAAWGTPTSVLLRCGVTPPGPTTQTCFTVGGIDWLRNSDRAPRFVFTTFGRTPATQVIIDTGITNVSGSQILEDLANAVGSVKQAAKCLNREDVFGGTGLPTATPSPTPTPTPTPTK